MKKFTFEIESSGGDMIMAFEVCVTSSGALRVLQVKNCSLADVDGDYIFNTENDLYRMQAD